MDWLRFANKLDDRELTELESLLQVTLAPVPPRRNYEHDLQKRLSGSHLEVAFPQPKWPKYLLLALSAMTVGMAVLIFVVRVVVAYRMRRG